MIQLKPVLRDAPEDARQGCEVRIVNSNTGRRFPELNLSESW